MKIELFAMCDFAADYGGKLNVVGIFDSIFAAQMPVVHAHCCIAARIRFEKIEEGQKRVRISVSDADGKPLLPAFEIPITVAMPADGSSHTIHVVGNIGGMKIDRYGEYSIDLAVEGRQEASIPLFVRHLPQKN